MNEEKWKKENFELWNSISIKEAYMGKNYKEINCSNDSNNCILFFSSNGLYYPNTIKEFKKTITQENRYEWEHIASSGEICQSFGKIIFIRDIYKQWYVKGINNICDNINKLFHLLAELTKGYDIITVGSSSGGYAAILLGVMLHAKKIYSFAGQFSIEDEVKDYYWLNLYRLDATRSQYYNIIELLKTSNIPVYYFYAGKCEQDILQYNLAMDYSNLRAISFDSTIHAKTMYNADMPWVISSSAEKLNEVCDKCYGSLIEAEQFHKNYIS